MTTATVYDAITPGNLPTTGDGYLAYADGAFANVAGVKAVAGNRPVKTITVAADLDADMMDSEDHNPTPSQAANWARAKISAGKGRPTTYCPLLEGGYSLNEQQAAVRAVGLNTSDVDYFPASYDGVAAVPAGCVGKQWRGDVPPGFDQSIVDAGWLGTVPTPVPTPTGPNDSLVVLSS